jgi:hypothetical protein
MLIFAISIAEGEIQRKAGWTVFTTQSAVPVEELPHEFRSCFFPGYAGKNSGIARRSQLRAGC